MTSLEGMLKMADGVIAKRWQWRVSIDDPSFHDFFHTPLPPPQKKFIVIVMYMKHQL